MSLLQDVVATISTVELNQIGFICVLYMQNLVILLTKSKCLALHKDIGTHLVIPTTAGTGWMVKVTVTLTRTQEELLTCIYTYATIKSQSQRAKRAFYLPVSKTREEFANKLLTKQTVPQVIQYNKLRFKVFIMQW